MAAKSGLGTKKTGLGKKGMDTLIPAKINKEKTAAAGAAASDKNGMLLPIDKVEPNKDQPRKEFNEDALEELADSIKQYGVIEPLVVVKRDNYYMIVTGERRWRASRLAGLKEVPVVVKDLTDLEIAEISLIENLQREDLNAIEEALAYKRLIEEFHMKQDEVAEKVSKSRTVIANSVRLLKLAEKVQQMIIDKMITTGHARALLGIDNQEEQIKLAEEVYDKGLTVRETEKLVKAAQNKKAAAGKTPAAPAIDSRTEAIYHDLEEEMKKIFGTKVSIATKDAKSGKVEIEYYNTDELDRIIELIRGIK